MVCVYALADGSQAVSRAQARAALREAGTELVCGLSWVPEGLLDDVATRSDSPDLAQALAVTAAAVPVDLAFVSARGADAPDAVSALHAAGIAAIWAVDGVFTRVADAIGWGEALRMTASQPGALAARLDEALHDALVLVRRACETGADAVLIADDLAGPSGPLLSPDYALDALMPCYRRLAFEAKRGELPAIFHSDGDIRMLLPALVREGYSAVHVAGLGAETFEASALAARRVGLVVLGGIAVQELLTDACRAGERAAAVATSLGNVIVCDDGGMTTFEEVVAFGSAIEAARHAYGHPRAHGA